MCIWNGCSWRSTEHGDSDGRAGTADGRHCERHAGADDVFKLSQFNHDHCGPRGRRTHLAHLRHPLLCRVSTKYVTCSVCPGRGTHRVWELRKDRWRCGWFSCTVYHNLQESHDVCIVKANSSAPPRHQTGAGLIVCLPVWLIDSEGGSGGCGSVARWNF